MASPLSERLALTPKTQVTTLMTPFTVPDSGGRVFRTPLTDEAIWKRLKEAGFDEESIKRRDKAALIANIARLEAEVFSPFLNQFTSFCIFSPSYTLSALSIIKNF